MPKCNAVPPSTQPGQGTTSDMNDAHGAIPYSQHTVLRNGTPVHVRGVRPGDKERVVAAFGKLDKESVYTRFFTYKKALSSADLERLRINDGQRGAALVVTVDEGGDEVVIAGGSYAAHPGRDGVPTAEVAFTVEEDYHRQGIAGLLLAALADIARAHGFARLDAEVLMGNAAMLAVFERSGLPLRKSREGGVVHVEMDLQPPPAGAPAP
jgi:GNAT superfamily N-acetyltransferase